MSERYGPAEKSGSANKASKQFGSFNRDVAPQHAGPGYGAPKGAVKANGAPQAVQEESEFVRDEAYEASSGVGQALAAVDANVPAILLTGRAGTGKTRLVQYIKSRPGGELQATVAPTGIAALNARAQTIHSFFHLEQAVLDAKRLSKGGKFGGIYRRMKRLVIDEISMVRADVIDAIDARLRAIRMDKRPFGGVQVILVGDFLQLPPVVQEQDWPMLENLGYAAPYAFNAHVLQSLPVETVMLDRVWRQGELDFVDMLGAIRTREGIEDALTRLNARCVGPHRDGVQPLLLTPTRAAAERYNNQGLAALGRERIGFRGTFDGDFAMGAVNLPVPEHIDLAPGARVMAVRNDPGGRFVNGTLGTVVRLDGEGGVFVQFDRRRDEDLVMPVTWEKIRQQWNEAEQRIDNQVVGTYKQIPLIHAWAVTIHKAQGLTLDDVRVDLGSGAFAPGQVYVALSRVRTLDGLSFARPLRASDVRADPVLVAFMRWARDQSGSAGGAA
jgi:ATP-dependent exoDNAse (exonuclease V) alpha subunit